MSAEDGDLCPCVFPSTFYSTDDSECPSREDVEYVLQLTDKKVENVLKIAKSPGHPSQYLRAGQFFRGTHLMV